MALMCGQNPVKVCQCQSNVLPLAVRRLLSTHRRQLVTLSVFERTNADNGVDLTLSLPSRAECHSVIAPSVLN